MVCIPGFSSLGIMVVLKGGIRKCEMGKCGDEVPSMSIRKPKFYAKLAVFVEGLVVQNWHGTLTLISGRNLI